MKYLIWGCLFSLLLFISETNAKTIIVPTDYLTIQDAVESSVNYDTVLVLDGIYRGDGNRNIDFNGKLIVLQSLNGPRQTIIDCEGASSSTQMGFLLHSGETLEAVIDGFTITGGYGNTAGGAFFISYSNPTIKNCIFLNNYASAMGGAISISHGGGLLKECIFSDNVANTDNSIIVSFFSSLTIQNCTFFGNGINQIGSEISSIVNIKNSVIINGSVIAWNGEDILGYPPGTVTIQDNIFYSANAHGVLDGIVTGTSETIDPLICDSVNYLYSLEPSSPCLAENNQFGVLIGASDSICVPTDIDDDILLPTKSSLSQNYPNPFNPSTTIEYELVKNSNVKITVQNILGETITVLVDEYKSAGAHVVVWDGKDDTGDQVSTGVYFYKIETDGYSKSKKMLLLK